MSKFVKKVISVEEKKFNSQKVTRIYHENRHYLTNKAVLNLYQNLKKDMQPGQRIMLRAMTEYGPRTLKGFDTDDIQFETTEKYLEGTSNPKAKPYRRLSYIDVYVVKNKTFKKVE
jgi:hypothetical protein